MEVKLLEVRDRATFIAAIAIRATFRDDEERWLLRRAGYAIEQIEPELKGIEPYILFAPLDGGKPLEYDPFAQPNRTMSRAHLYAVNNWDTLKSGDVIDVEFILGESTEPKQSERVVDEVR
jgi:hypothetical protein